MRGFAPAVSISLFIFRFFVLIGLLLVEQFLEHFFVKGRTRDYIFLCRPVAQIQQTAPFTAKRKLRIRLRIRRLLANWTFVLHDLQNRATNLAVPANPQDRVIPRPAVWAEGPA